MLTQRDFFFILHVVNGVFFVNIFFKYLFTTFMLNIHLLHNFPNKRRDCEFSITITLWYIAACVFKRKFDIELSQTFSKKPTI